MARRLPQLLVEDVGGDDLLKTALHVLRTHHVLQCAVNVRSARQEETRAGAQVVEEKEVLLRANLAVVALGCLLQQVLVLLHGLRNEKRRGRECVYVC